MPRFDSLLIVATLAVGTAAATAIFSIYDQVFLRPLPYPAPHEIVSLRGVSVESSTFTGVRILEGRIPEGVFRATGLVQPGGVNVTADGATFRASAAVVNAEFFQVMGVPPVTGRPFTADEEQTSRVAVVSERLWLGRLNGTNDLRESTVVVNGRAFDVVGVMPRGFDYPDSAEIWLPLRADRQAAGSSLLPTLRPPSPAEPLAAAALLVLVALASALLPAHAATRVDPIAALKSE